MRYSRFWDPGNVTGYAIFEYGRLVCATDAKFEDVMQWPPSYPLGCGGSVETVIEIPQIYRLEHQKGDPNDLIGLAYKAGRIAERHGTGGPITLLYPREWKGQLPKSVTMRRAKKALTAEELRIVPGEDHNMWDAIGIGLHCLKRTP